MLTNVDEEISMFTNVKLDFYKDIYKETVNIEFAPLSSPSTSMIAARNPIAFKIYQDREDTYRTSSAVSSIPRCVMARNRSGIPKGNFTVSKFVVF
tara:strand:+ start:414 stop:701 length:288 start_codon:yes stop_codon:yes gene_type:complete